MNKFKIVEIEERIHYGGRKMCYCNKPEVENVHCTVCATIVDHNNLSRLRYYDRDTDNENYQVIRLEDYLYSFCSITCRELFELSPLAYE